jgi:molybdate-binding protein
VDNKYMATAYYIACEISKMSLEDVDQILYNAQLVSQVTTSDTLTVLQMWYRDTMGKFRCGLPIQSSREHIDTMAKALKEIING